MENIKIILNLSLWIFFTIKVKIVLKNSIDKFLNEIFGTEMTFSKSDLDLLTDLYKLMEKNVE